MCNFKVNRSMLDYQIFYFASKKTDFPICQIKKGLILIVSDQYSLYGPRGRARTSTDYSSTRFWVWHVYQFHHAGSSFAQSRAKLWYHILILSIKYNITFLPRIQSPKFLNLLLRQFQSTLRIKDLPWDALHLRLESVVFHKNY